MRRASTGIYHSQERMQTKDGFILKGLNYRFVGDTACAFVSIKELIGFHFGRSQLG